MLVVSVPVLSEQITEVHPKVSTDGNDRTIAFFLAMRRVPRAKQVVITAGKPESVKIMCVFKTQKDFIPRPSFIRDKL